MLITSDLPAMTSPIMVNDGAADRVQKLTEVFEKHRGEKHLVVLHDYPDPDAISAAFAHRLISAEYDIDVDIVYSGKISNSQNIALVNLLNIGLIPYEDRIVLDQYEGAVYVDNQGGSNNTISNAIESAGIPVVIVVDHHEDQGDLDSEYSDIRKVGSTATIYARYIEEGLLRLKRGQKEHVAVATALMHGILIDTEGFVKGDLEDFHSAAYLSQFRDAELLEHIMNQSWSKQVMDVIRRALGNRMVVENLSIAGIGYLRSEDRDAIPQAAEFLKKEENVHTAIVYGIVRNGEQDEILTGSMRTSKVTLDPDDFIKEVFGAGPDGRYYGGGKHMAGSFTIPLGFLSGNLTETYAEQKWQVFDKQVKAKVFARLGVNIDGRVTQPSVSNN